MDIENGRFVLELDLKPELFEFHILEKRFEIGRQISKPFVVFEDKSAI